ncbi:MAG: phosphosulfolactate synthase [Anaerolineales bacterium]|nr:phosphosulfolactate synthase [Anaerolineales bacterium]
MKTKAWGNLIYPLAPGRISVKPRQQGLTMILDRCQGLNDSQDLLALTGDYIDYIKLSFGTSVFVDESLLRRKIELVRAHEIDIYPGGTLMEIALFQGVYPQFVRRARALGFTALEISDGSITIPRQVRDDCIKQALDAGLKVISEVGKKDSTQYIPPTELAEQIARDLALGVEKVIVEAREAGRGIGIYDEEGRLRGDEMAAIINYLGDNQDEVLWEAPLPSQQSALILRCGPNVNLGNVKPNDVLGLEAMRCGLRFETFRHFAPSQGEMMALPLSLASAA